MIWTQYYAAKGKEVWHLFDPHKYKSKKLSLCKRAAFRPISRNGYIPINCEFITHGQFVNYGSIPQPLCFECLIYCEKDRSMQ